MAVVYSREARSFASISEIDIPLSHPAKTMANNKAANGLKDLKAFAPCSFVIIILLFIIVFVEIVIVILVVEVVIVLVVNFVIIEFIVVVL